MCRRGAKIKTHELDSTPGLLFMQAPTLFGLEALPQCANVQTIQPITGELYDVANGGLHKQHLPGHH